MQFINNQYKIIKMMNEDKYGSTMLVEDTNAGHLLKVLRIVDAQKETTDFIEYMKRNIFEYKNFIHINLAEVFFINKIVVIDRKPVVTDKYYYTYEYVVGKNLFNFVKNEDFDTILDLAVQLCKALKYLHLKGYILCNVNIDDLTVIEDKQENILKIIALPYIEGTETSLLLDKDNINFKAPEVMQSEKYTTQSDIYLLGVILFYMFSKEKAEDTHFREALSVFDVDTNDISTGQILNIIKKCTALRPENRYASVDEIVEDINTLFDKSYSAIDKKYIQVLPRNITKLSSRENNMQRLISNVKGYLYENGKIRMTVIRGDIGVGKWTFLYSAHYRLQQEGIRVIIEKLNEELKGSFYIINFAIKEIIKYIDKEIVDKYSSDLAKIIPEILDEISSTPLNTVIEEQNKIRLIYRIGNFLLEAAARLPFTIIINKFQWIDNDSKEVLKYILKNENKGKVHVLISIDNDSLRDCKEYCDLYEAVPNEYIDIMELSNYNINETAEYIRLLLGMKKAPLDFGASIYKETEGNPNYIYEAIYLLYVNNYIYIDDKGEWVLNSSDLDNIKLSVSIDDIILNKIKSLNSVQKEIIEAMSVFNSAVSSDILEDILNIDGDRLFSELNYLTSINILSRKVDDWGITFDFSSINLKKSIYENIEPNKKLLYHNKVSYILEEKFENENRENKDELIYHMTKANRLDEAIDQLMFSADKMVSSNLLNQAIQFLEQTYNLFDKKEVNKKKIAVCFKLGDLYLQIGEYNKAQYFYDIVENIAEIINDKKILIDVYIKKFALHYKLNDNINAMKYAILAKKILRDVDYKEGLYELLINLDDMAVYRRKHNTYSNIIGRLINDEEVKNNKLYYARLLWIYGRHNYYKGRFTDSVEACKKSADILEELGAYKYLPKVLNSIGVNYSDYFNDYQKAREYYEKGLNIAIKINDMRTMENCYNNLAETYRFEDNYQETLEYYNKGLDVVHISKNLYMKLLLHQNIILVYIATEDYKKAEEHINVADELLKDVNDTGNLEEFAYRCKAEFYYVMGDYEAGRSYAQKAVDMCINWGVAMDFEAYLIKVLAEAKLTDELNFTEHMKFCKRLFGEYLQYKQGRLTCVKLAEIYANKKMTDKALKLLELGNNYTDKIDTEILRQQYDYVDAISSTGDEKLIRLMNLAVLINSIEYNEIKCKVYKAIADEYMTRGNNQEALKYYISALNYLRKLVHNVPDEYKISFVMSHERNTIKEGLIKASEQLTSKSKGKRGTKSARKPDSKEQPGINLKNIDRYFDYTDYIDIYRYRETDQNKSGASVDIYSYNRFLFKMQELIDKFTDDNIENLKNMINMFAEIIQAKNAFIATLDEEENLNILASYNRYFETPFYKYIIEQVKQKKDSIIVLDAFEYNKKKGDILIPRDMTAVFCIPIMGAGEEDHMQMIEDKRRIKGQSGNHVTGYIYMDTDSIINNFTEETSHFCIGAAKLAYILVDNYNLRIVSAIEKLTKLYTRKYFETALMNEISYTEKEGGEFCVIMIDIDKFKTVNDRFGHQKGDEILQNVSNIIMNTVRKGDICARYGGEEIIVLLPGTDIEGGYHVAEKIRRKIENAKLLGLHNPLTVSLGVSSYPEHSTWAKDLIEKADQALYYAKESGRNMSCVYQPNMSKSVKRIDKLAGIISGNLVEDQRKVESMLEILELQRNNELSYEEKIFKFLGRIIEVSEAQTGILFYVNEERNITGKLARKKFIDTEVNEAYYSEGIVKRSIENQTAEYMIDWGNYPGIDTVTGMPDWQSIIAIPLVNNGKMKSLLYLSVSVKNKEFDAGVFNFIKTLCDIIAAIY